MNLIQLRFNSLKALDAMSMAFGATCSPIEGALTVSMLETRENEIEHTVFRGGEIVYTVFPVKIRSGGPGLDRRHV